MKWTVLFAAILAALGAFSTTPVIAQDVSDVVRARGNARAGGSTSGHNSYILKKHGGALSGTHTKAAKKKAAAKHRARKAAKKKAAAKRRAAIAAKKKKEAQRRAALASKKKAEKRRADAKAENTDDNKSGTTATATPSTAAVLTNQDINADDKAADKSDDTTVTAASDTAGSSDQTETTAEANDSSVGAKASDDEKGCKRFVPEVGKTVSVDC